MKFIAKLVLLSWLVLPLAWGAEDKKDEGNDSFRWSIEHGFGLSYASLEKKVKKLKKERRGQIPKNLTEDELIALYGYTQTLYRTVNAFLRQDETLTVSPYVKAMDSALEKLPVYEGEVVRSANVPVDVAKTYVVGGFITIPAYAAASIRGLRPGRDRFKIHSLSARKLGGLADVPADGDVIFPRNSKFRVLAKKKNKDETTDYELEELKAEK